MTDEPGFRHRKTVQKGRMSVIRKSFLAVRTTIGKKIKGKQHHSRHVKPTSASTECPSMADGWAKLSWVIYKYFGGYRLFQAHEIDISSHGFYWNVYLIAPNHFHLLETRNVRAGPFITQTDKTHCHWAHQDPIANLTRRLGLAIR